MKVYSGTNTSCTTATLPTSGSSYSTIDRVDNIISYNRCTSSTNATRGGGISAWGDSAKSILVAHNTITYNKALSTANHYQGGIGGGLWIGEYSNTEVYRNKNYQKKLKEMEKVAELVKQGIVIECRVDDACEKRHAEAAKKIWDEVAGRDAVAAKAIQLTKDWRKTLK